MYMMLLTDSCSCYLSEFCANKIQTVAIFFVCQFINLVQSQARLKRYVMRSVGLKRKVKWSSDFAEEYQVVKRVGDEYHVCHVYLKRHVR